MEALEGIRLQADAALDEFRVRGEEGIEVELEARFHHPIRGVSTLVLGIARRNVAVIFEVIQAIRI